jgi:hypothetical protein
VTGPEHYLEAESLLDFVQHSGPDPAGELIAAAQVHATLALAAAFASARLGEMFIADSDAWQDLATTPPTMRQP